MKLSYHFVLFFAYFSALSTSSYIIGSSRFVKVPLPLFRESLVSTMELVQTLASTMSQIYGDVDDDGPNLNVSIPHCANLLRETAGVLSWTLAAINQEYSQG